MPTENWTNEVYAEFIEELKSFADEKYRQFHTSLVPNEEKDSFLGVRMPKLRELGKEISKRNPRGFLAICKSDYYEEKMLRGIVTGLVKPKDYDDFISLADSFVPYVSNWALCDCFCSGLKYVKKCREQFFEHLKTYLSGNIWAIRVALVLMLNYYLDDEYIAEVLKRVDSVHSEEYYVKMAQAWLLATALAKCPEPALAYYEDNSLDDFTHNKAIQKAIESYRIDGETKNYLRSLKRY